MKEKDKDRKIVDEKNGGEAETDGVGAPGNTDGPDLARLLTAIAICAALLVIAKFFVL